MRWPLASTVAIAVALVAPAAAAQVVASAPPAGDDLPSGNETPRFVPIAVVDTYYAYHDTPPPGREATLSTTAIRHNEFNLNLVSLGGTLQHAKLLGTIILQAGTSVDALYPSNPALGRSSNTETWKHIQVATVGYRITQNLDFEAGVFPSHIGHETFVSTANWNYTRSMLADSTPYFLAGAKGTWRASPKLTLTALVYNGWQTYYDVNRYKKGALMLQWRPTETLSLSDSISIGPEVLDHQQVRYFNDFIVTWAPHPRLAFAGEFAAGLDHRPNKADGQTDPKYWAADICARWNIGDTTYFALRGERIVDDSGILTFTGARVDAQAGSGQRLMGGTFTIGFLPHPKLLARVEASHRVADRDFFAGGSGNGGVPGVRSDTTTFVASMAFSY